MAKIPKILIQTSRNNYQKLYVVKMLALKAKNWSYIHFNDNEIINFFKKNPIDEFPNIISIFNSIKSGAHKADLFRYYFIYINGGVFVDDDAMLQCNLDYICKDYDFFSVNSSYCPKCIFQGFLGATPKNDIIYEALKDAYNINIEKLNNDYLLICRNLYNIIHNKKWDMNIKLYDEIYGSDRVALTVDMNDNKYLLLVHYYCDKKIPREKFNISHIRDYNFLHFKRRLFMNFIDK